MLARPLIICPWTQQIHDFILFLVRIYNNKYIIEGAPAFDKRGSFDLTILSRLCAGRLIGILIDDQILVLIVACDEAIMPHPAILAVDIGFIDTLFHNYGKARGDYSLEQFDIPTVANDR